jgi:choline dehydrogenase
VGAETFTAACQVEVVLTAGTVGTPQLLMLSGIGPRAHLRGLGIDVVTDLPGVGRNLHDHPMSGVVYSSARPVPAGTNNHGEVQGLVSTGIGLDGPDVQIMFVDVPLRADALPGPDMGEGYAIVVSLLAPFSRGSLRLASNVPGAAPTIDPRYYTDPRDLDMMVAGLRMAREIGCADALAPWRGPEALPGPGVVGDEQLRAYLRRNIRSYSHYAGTCALGTDELAVVDTELRVRGVDGLRVADASVMPSPASANTNATVYAIAERAADLIGALPKVTASQATEHGCLRPTRQPGTPQRAVDVRCQTCAYMICQSSVYRPGATLNRRRAVCACGTSFSLQPSKGNSCVMD